MEYSKQTRDDLLSLRGRLLKQIGELQERVRAIDVILPELAQGAKEPLRAEAVVKAHADVIPSQVVVSASSLRGLKQLTALKTIARAQSGLVRTNDAKELMMQAGVMKKSKNAYKMVYNLLKNSDEFQPSGNPGEYRLIEAMQPLLQ